MKLSEYLFNVKRSGLITFCGSIIEIEFDVDGIDGKECFRLYEDGHYKGGKPIVTRHPNIVKSVLTGKKGWGLWLDQWTDGIVDWTFTRDDILNEFEKVNIEIPESFIRDFDNTIERKKRIRNLEYYKKLNNL